MIQNQIFKGAYADRTLLVGRSINNYYSALGVPSWTPPDTAPVDTRPSIIANGEKYISLVNGLNIFGCVAMALNIIASFVVHVKPEKKQMDLPRPSSFVFKSSKFQGEMDIPHSPLIPRKNSQPHLQPLRMPEPPQSTPIISNGSIKRPQTALLNSSIVAEVTTTHQYTFGEESPLSVDVTKCLPLRTPDGSSPHRLYSQMVPTRVTSAGSMPIFSPLSQDAPIMTPQQAYTPVRDRRSSVSSLPSASLQKAATVAMKAAGLYDNDELFPESPAPSAPLKSAAGTNLNESRVRQATVAYKASLEDELTVMPLDFVQVEKTWPDGWGVGTNLRTGMYGAFPMYCFVDPTTDEYADLVAQLAVKRVAASRCQSLYQLRTPGLSAKLHDESPVDYY